MQGRPPVAEQGTARPVSHLTPRTDGRTHTHTHTHTCLGPGTLPPSGGEKGNTLCFHSVFSSAGAKKKKSDFEDSMTTSAATV